MKECGGRMSFHFVQQQQQHQQQSLFILELKDSNIILTSPTNNSQKEINYRELELPRRRKRSAVFKSNPGQIPA